MKNDVIIYTQPEFKDEILEIREGFGLKAKTKIVTIDNIYELFPDMYKRMQEVENDN